MSKTSRDWHADDPALKGLWVAAYLALNARPRDIWPLRVLGDYYEGHGHAGCADGCRQSHPLFLPPVLSYLTGMCGLSDADAESVRDDWWAQAKAMQDSAERGLVAAGD